MLVCAFTTLIDASCMAGIGVAPLQIGSVEFGIQWAGK